MIRHFRAALSRQASLGLLCAGLALVATTARAQSPVPPAFEYRVQFPAVEQRWMQVEARFPGLPGGPAEIRMSRVSPGRYALHEFAKNVFDVQVTDGQGRLLAPRRPSLHQWDVAGHDGTVVVRYKVFGDRTDGTYLSVDPGHAHINAPAAFMFVRGALMRPARVRFERPAGRAWQVATQLFPTDDPLAFTAPNLHYLMDSPIEFSGFVWRTFTIDDGVHGPQTIRIALHHDGTDVEADEYARDVEKIVRQQMRIFGELPKFDGGTYTFLADYLPWADGDGMEHRNSTVVSNRGALRQPAQRQSILGTVSHEFFHAWNMERIRARAIEPFNYEDANMSDELWFGEGFTNYFDGVALARAGLLTEEQLLGDFAGIINAVTLSPGRQLRSAIDMSRLAPFVDAAASIDRTAWPNLFISYYTYGSAIGFALDLSLRDRSDGAVSGDDYMRAVWQRFGRTPSEPGMVATPYTIADLEAVLAQVSGDRVFARDFFARYVEGRELVDYARLLKRAGLIVRRPQEGRPTMGSVQLSAGAAGVRVASLVAFDAPLARAGVAQDDHLVALDGVELTQPTQVAEILARHRPGDQLALRAVRRSGERFETSVTLAEDQRIDVVPAEQAGQPLSDEMRRFRERWVGVRP